MKSLRLHNIGDLRFHDDPVPVPNKGEELVNVQAVGICGSDLHWVSEAGIGDAKLDHPLVLGHEFAGITEDGEIVAVDPAIPCRKCEFCEQGHPNLCEETIFAGHGTQDGALREWLVWPKRLLFPLPDSFSAIDGAMLEPLGVAIHAVDLGRLRTGITVGVFGCGPIGLLIVQLARLSGASNIIATDILPHRVEAAISLGAQHAFLVNNQLDPDLIRSATGGRGIDVVFEAAGEQAAVDDAFTAVISGGKVILSGIPSDDRTVFTASVARRKGLTIKMVRRMKHTYRRAIELVSNNQIDVRSLVTHRFSIDNAVEAFEIAQKREGLKIIIEV